jgi:hypothetical protein
VEAAEPQVGVDVPLRIDDDGSAAALVTDEIGGAGQVLVDDLTEEDGYSAFAELRIAFRIVPRPAGPFKFFAYCGITAGGEGANALGCRSRNREREEPRESQARHPSRR